jgi:class 3 adenylate cyclase
VSRDSIIAGISTSSERSALAARSVERRLSAILSADACGYSRLMAHDELHTIQKMRDHRTVMQRLIEEGGGRVVDAVGDNLLGEFGSVVEAVESSVRVQQELSSRNAELLPDRRLVFRIGIHVGDVVVDGDRIAGDGVNVAARIEALAPPGGISVSGAVYEQVHGKLAFGFKQKGLQRLKNIPHLVPVYDVRFPVLQEDGNGYLRSSIRLRGNWLLAGGFAAVILLVLWVTTHRTPPIPPISEAEVSAASIGLPAGERAAVSRALLGVIVSVRPGLRARESLEAYPGWASYLAALAEESGFGAIRTETGAVDLRTLEDILNDEAMLPNHSNSMSVLDQRFPDAEPFVVAAFLRMSDLELHEMHGWVVQAELATLLGRHPTDWTPRALSTVLQQLDHPDRSRLAPPLVQAARSALGSGAEFDDWFRATFGSSYDAFEATRLRHE